MNAKLVQIINVERQRYVDFFVAETEFLSRGKETFATELPIQTNGEPNYYPFNIIRVDFITKDKDNEHSISELRLEKNLDYETHEFTIDNLKLSIKPFCWNSCELQVDKVDIENLKRWVITWLKIDIESGNEKIVTSVHSCTSPEFQDNRFLFTIDFGTATEDAFLDFFKMLKDTGTTEAIIQTIEV